MALHPTSRLSIGQLLDANRGVGPGFDFLRVFLAAVVVLNHSYVIVGLQPEFRQSTWFMGYWVLAVFFGLSGFLITGSALRLSLKNFLINRSLRIVPALAVDIVFAALILGPIFSTLPIADYIRDRQFATYFLNIMGYIHYELPGLFKSHPSPRVNTSLWTVPFEIGCYGIMACLIVFGLLRRPKVILGLTVGFAVVGLALLALEDGFPVSLNMGRALHALFVDRGSRLFVCFLLGILAFQWRYQIPYNRILFAACVLWCVVLGVVLSPFSLWARFPVLNVIAAVPLIYVMVFVGCTRMPRLPLFHRGDYSYGIYLYGFPVQQVVYQAWPSVESPLLRFLIEVPGIVLFAMFSWHAIEQPILQMRKKFSFIAKQRLSEAQAHSVKAAAASPPADVPRSQIL